jgi:hypothetical protein
MGRLRVVAMTALVAATAIALAGCVQGNASPTHAPSSSPTASPSVKATATPAPTFITGGTAKDNEPLFDQVSKSLIASDGSVDGKSIVDALVAAGFDKATMQVTPDKTPTGLAVDSVLFSVRIGDECLLGQRSSSGFSGSLARAIEDGSVNGCLIGKTRPIDW